MVRLLGGDELPAENKVGIASASGSSSVLRSVTEMLHVLFSGVSLPVAPIRLSLPSGRRT